MRGLHRRLARLEQPRHGSICPVCTPQEDGTMRMVIAQEGVPYEEFCPGCGRSLVLTLTFDDRAMDDHLSTERAP